MNHHPILDFEEKEKPAFPLWKYGLIILVLAAFLIPGNTFFIQDETPIQRFNNAWQTSFITLPTIALLIGLIGAIIPYRGRPYRGKLVRITLIAWMIPLAVFDVGLILAFFVNFVFRGARINI